MKVLNPNNANHTISFIGRYESTGDVQLYLYNESTTEVFTDTYASIITDGYTSLTFPYTFTEGQKFQIKILNDNLDVLYRGKLIATAEETQTFLADNNEYYYE